jgi:NADH dehydrogenase [ubiquinone] 1 alpha subcomplex assembly factor 7
MVHVPLGQRMARLIGSQGPISLQMWMGEANAHYYATRDPLGAGGDFTTAPEISQMFGEMIGVWIADVWSRAGSRPDAAYVELGPGRGTLAGDALRVMRRFGWAGSVHFVETSPTLRAAQAGHAPDAVWHDDLSSLPDTVPLMIVANEFLDALPVRQLVKTPRGWRERMVGLHEGRFLPVAGTLPMDLAVPEAFRDAQHGAIVEASPAAATVMGEIARRLATQGGAGLVVDYGYDAPQMGSTLQALKNHAAADPFADPGEVDLTTLVDFHAAARAPRRRAYRWWDRWGRGLSGRSWHCTASRRFGPRRSRAHGRVRRRPRPSGGGEQMGTLFRVLGLAGRGWPVGAGFQ